MVYYPRKRTYRRRRPTYRRNSRKRTYSRRARGAVKISQSKRAHYGLEATYHSILRCASELTTYTPAATTGSLLFHLNSIYDPMATHGAVQPKYYDVFNGLYENYYVRGGWYKIILHNNAAGMVSIAKCLHFGTGASYPQTFRGTAEQGKLLTIGATDENTRNTTIIKGSWQARKLTSVAKNFGNLSALFAASPVNECMLILQFDAGDENNISIDYHVEFGFDVVLFNRKAVVPADV